MILLSYTVDVKVSGLNNPVMIALPRQDYEKMVPKVQAVYWESSDNTWNTTGCRISNTVEQAYHNLSIIECSHLTSFSLLQVRYYHLLCGMSFTFILINIFLPQFPLRNPVYSFFNQLIFLLSEGLSTSHSYKHR